MPGWAWMLLGAASALIAGYLWLAWYLRNAFRL